MIKLSLPAVNFGHFPMDVRMQIIQLLDTRTRSILCQTCSNLYIDSKPQAFKGPLPATKYAVAVHDQFLAVLSCSLDLVAATNAVCTIRLDCKDLSTPNQVFCVSKNGCYWRLSYHQDSHVCSKVYGSADDILCQFAACPHEMVSIKTAHQLDRHTSSVSLSKYELSTVGMKFFQASRECEAGRHRFSYYLASDSGVDDFSVHSTWKNNLRKSFHHSKRDGFMIRRKVSDPQSVLEWDFVPESHSFYADVVRKPGPGYYCPQTMNVSDACFVLECDKHM